MAVLRVLIVGPGERVLVDLAGASGRGPARVDAGADVDAVWLAGDSLDRRGALLGRAGYRRPGGNSFQGRRAHDAGHPGAAGSARVSRRALRRGTGSPRRGAQLAGHVLSGRGQRPSEPWT